MFSLVVLRRGLVSPQAGLELASWPRMTLNWSSSCLLSQVLGLQARATTLGLRSAGDGEF